MKEVARQILISVAIFALFVSFGARNTVFADPPIDPPGGGQPSDSPSPSASVPSLPPGQLIRICHAAGQLGTLHYETLNLPPEGIFGAHGQAGHFIEPGTPQAGHENDLYDPTDGLCPTSVLVASPSPSPSPSTSPSPTASPDPSSGPLASPSPSPSPSGDPGNGGSSDGDSNTNTGGVVLGASTSSTSARVLGARTMASAGSSDNILQLVFIAGSLLSGFGIKMYGSSKTKRS